MTGSLKPKCYTSTKHALPISPLETEPTSYTQASKSPKWQVAMSNELNPLIHNQTWTLVHLPPDRSPIGCKWVYRIKQKYDGTVDRYKARLVAKSFHQWEGVDYFETYNPVVKLITIRMVLTLAFTYKWHIQQLNVKMPS